MRRSQYFLPTLKETPAEATIASHRLMLRAGMIRQQSTGQYSWLPLGLRVLGNITKIVKQYLDAAGCQEVLLPMLQPAELWQETDRLDAYGKEMLKMHDRHERTLIFGPTAEEAITDIFRNNIKSYKQLPQTWYQCHWKFRDEIRPRFGVMRGREFLMQDAYSFDVDYDAARKRYEQLFTVYLQIFKALGVTAVPVQADPGSIGGNLSHEFHVVADTGESGLFYDQALDEEDITLERLENFYARTDELHDANNCPVPNNELRQRRGIEVGHIFYLGDKYSKAMNAVVNTAEGSPTPVHMGCYGIGLSRLVGAIIEASHDDRGIIWPKAVAPFDAGIVCIQQKDAACVELCEQLFKKLREADVSVLYDDRTISGGAKLADMELIGLPTVLTVGPRTAKEGKVEVKDRATGKVEVVELEAALQSVTN